MTDILNLKEKAESYLAEGKLDLAKECYLEAIALSPNQAQIYHKLGEIFSLQKSWQEAVDAYCKAVKINQNFSFSYHKLGEALKELGSYREAVEAYKSAIKLKPEFPWSYHKLGEILMELENWEEAILAYRQFIEINPDFPVAYHKLGDACQEKGLLDEAVSCYNRVLEKTPDSAVVQKKLGQLWQQLGRPQEAISCYQKLIKLQPNNWKLYSMLGQFLVELGEFEEAIATFNKAIKLNSKEWSLYQTLGDVFIKIEAWEEAICCFIKALQIKLDYYDAFGKIADILKQKGELEAANYCRNSHEIPQKMLEKFCNLTKNWEVKSRDRQSNITVIELAPDTQIDLLASQTIDLKINPMFQAQKVNLPSAYVATVHQGRALNYGSITAIISSDNKIVTDICKGSAGLVLSSSNLPPVSHIDGTVAFLSIFPENSYFFWMFYVVARIACLLESGIELASIDKFFVTRCDRKFQKESLEIAGIPRGKIEESRFFPHIKADKLIVPSLPRLRDFRNPKWACDFLKKMFLRGRDTSDRSSYSERIYISRKLCSWRRVINEEEVISCLNKFGFTTIILEKMHLREQALCLANAKVVVAPHGAGLVNLVFSKPGTKVVEFFSPNYFNRAYWQISNICGLDHYHLIGEIFEEQYKQVWEPNILVDLKKLRKILALAGVI